MIRALAFLLLLAGSLRAAVVDYDVCASGCTYTNVQVAAAVGNVVDPGNYGVTVKSDLTGINAQNFDNSLGLILYLQTDGSYLAGTARTWFSPDTTVPNIIVSMQHQTSFDIHGFIFKPGNLSDPDNFMTTIQIIDNDVGKPTTIYDNEIWTSFGFAAALTFDGLNAGGVYARRNAVRGLTATATALGGFVFNSCTVTACATIENCLFENFAGIPVIQGPPNSPNTTLNVYNVTIANWYADIFGGFGAMMLRSPGDLRNIAFVNNVTDYVTTDAGTNASFTYCAFGQAANFGGAGNVFGVVAADAYVNAAGGDYKVKDGSSVLFEAGANLGGGYIDLAAVTRPKVVEFDIGTFELDVTATPTFTTSPTPTVSPTPTTTPTPSAKRAYIYLPCPESFRFGPCPEE